MKPDPRMRGCQKANVHTWIQQCNTLLGGMSINASNTQKLPREMDLVISRMLETRCLEGHLP